MIEQQGRVLSLDAGRVTVLVGASSGCPSCDAGKGCGAGIFGRLISRKPVALELELGPQEQMPLIPGQAVMIGIPEAFFLRLLAGFYLLPLLAGLLGAALGQALALAFQWDDSGQDLLAILGALFFAALTLLIRRKGSHKQNGKQVVQLLGYPLSRSDQLCPVGRKRIE